MENKKIAKIFIFLALILAILVLVIMFIFDPPSSSGSSDFNFAIFIPIYVGAFMPSIIAANQKKQKEQATYT